MVIDDEVSDLKCEDNLRIRREDCPPGRKVFTPVEVEYAYCNDESSNVMQVADPDKTKAVYRGENVGFPGLKNKLSGGQCNTLKIRKRIDLCKAGASMRMQYQGRNLDETGGLTQEFCFTFKFLQVRREFLPPGRCAINVSCA